MKIAITGGTGFIGKHLARDLTTRGHQVVIISRGLYSRNSGDAFPKRNISFVKASVTDADQLAKAFAGCAAIVDCAGTSQESKAQSFKQLHIDGASATVEAARKAGVKKLVLVSYLHVRPNVRSPYHTTKWQGENIVRESGLDYVILKAGLVYGRGDHLLNNLGTLLRKLPFFALVGFKSRTVRLIAVEDLVDVIRAALTDERLSQKTVAVIGPEEIPFSEAVRRIAKVLGKPSLPIIPLPVTFHRLLAWVSGMMPKPLIAAAQVQMLADGISEPLPDSQPLPDDLAPKTLFTEQQILKGLPAAS